MSFINEQINKADKYIIDSLELDYSKDYEKISTTDLSIITNKIVNKVISDTCEYLINCDLANTCGVSNSWQTEAWELIEEVKKYG